MLCVANLKAVSIADAESASVGEWGTSVLAELTAALASEPAHSVSYHPGCDAVE